MIIPCRGCRGKGCVYCQFVGKEQLIWKDKPVDQMTLLELYMMMQQLCTPQRGVQRPFEYIVGKTREMIQGWRDQEWKERWHEFLKLSEYITASKGKIALNAMPVMLPVIAERFNVAIDKVKLSFALACSE